MELICHPGALKDPVCIKLTLEEPYKHYGWIIQSRLENDVIFGARIVNCQPNGRKFNKPLILTITLDKEKETFNT